jgi:hypothetical protein
MAAGVVWPRASSTTCWSQATSRLPGNASRAGPAPKKWSKCPWVTTIARSCLPLSRSQVTSRLPSAVVASASTRIASCSPAMSVEVVAGQVAGRRTSQPGPGGVGL